MAVIIYDDEQGATTTKVFGCSFKSITAQMGFNSQPIVFTVTVVEEEDQDFTLDRYDVRSVQYVSFGELSILGIVQSWEKTTIDPNGTGIYTVRLTDCRSVLDSANIVGVYVYEPESVDNIIYVSTAPETPFVAEKGVFFNHLMERVEAATLIYGNNRFEIDMSALSNLTNWRGRGINEYYITGEIRSLVSVITEFCNSVGAEWWVESRRKSVTDNTIVIEIKVIRRLDGIGNPNALEMDELVELHQSDRIIRRKDGYESQPDFITHKIIWGGIKRQLTQFTRVTVKQFWGFDESGQPLLSPSYTMPDEPQYRRIPTTIEEMENVINGDLDGIMDADQLAALKRYVNTFWGKRFYISLNRNTLSDTGEDLSNYPEVIPAGWWEYDTPPNGVRNFDPDVLVKMTTEDGRWGPFVRLYELFLTGSGTIESPIESHYVTWAPAIQTSNNLILRESDSFMKCTLQQHDRYVIITLPVALTRYYLDPDTGELNDDRVTRHGEILHAWIPLMDRGIHYGPWTNTPLSASHVPLPGNSEVSVDKDLVPWNVSTRETRNDVAMEQLAELAAQKIDTLPGLSIINTGQLEVAGIPQVNIGQAIGLGGSITEVFIRFDSNSVSTRYVMNLYTKGFGDFKHRRLQFEEKQEEEEKKEEDDYPEIKDDIEAPPEPEDVASEIENLSGPNLKEREYIWNWPAGGLGFTVAPGTFGGYYDIRRVNAIDIDPQAYSAGVAMMAPAWTHVRNLAEPVDSPGFLPVGTQVTVSFFRETENSPQIPYIEQTPPNFSVMMTITSKSSEGAYYTVAGAGLIYEDVPNLSELSGPGYLLVGGKVIVSVVWEDGTYVPRIEQTPQVFSPPPLSTP